MSTLAGIHLWSPKNIQEASLRGNLLPKWYFEGKNTPRQKLRQKIYELEST